MSRQPTRRAEALLAASRLEFTLPAGRTLFRDLTLSFANERTGLVGPNGIGKSTLLRLLIGELQPTSGTVVARGRIGYLPQRATDRASREDLTVGDALGDTYGLSSALGRLIGDIPRDRPMSALSGGQRTRIALAAVALSEPDMLVLDEPTNDLDAESRAALHGFTERWRAGMLVISHDRGLLAHVDRIVEIASHGSVSYGGNFAAYEVQKATEDAAAHDELANARASLRRSERSVQESRERQARRQSQGKKSRADAGMPKIVLNLRREWSQNTAARLDDVGERVIADGKSRLEAARARVEERTRMRTSLRSAGLHAGKRVLEARSLRFTYPGGEAPALRLGELAIVGPERVAIAGANGSGKSTLLALVMRKLTPSEGTLQVGIPRDRIAYLDQQAAELDDDLSVLANLRRAAPHADEAALRTTLARYLFRRDAALAPVATLSGGERLRAALACALERDDSPQLLVLDEPTNHLDFDSLRAVEDALVAYDGALLVVSHDADFLTRIGIDRTITLSVPDS